MRLRLLFLPLVLAIVYGHSARAEFVSPIGIALLDFDHFHAELPGPESSVCGLRLTILRSVNKNLCGLDIGVVNDTAGTFTGIGLGLGANVVASHARIIGLQAAGLINIDGEISLLGIQIALVNRVLNDGTIIGAQLGLWNNAAKTDIFGFQFSGVNQARRVFGVQVGLVNIAESLYGLQIGLLNFNRSGPLKVVPIINVGF